MKNGADLKKDTKTLSAKKKDIENKKAQVKIKRQEIPNLLKNLQFNIKFY